MRGKTDGRKIRNKRRKRVIRSIDSHRQRDMKGTQNEYTDRTDHDGDPEPQTTSSLLSTLATILSPFLGEVIKVDQSFPPPFQDGSILS